LTGWISFHGHGGISFVEVSNIDHILHSKRSMVDRLSLTVNSVRWMTTTIVATAAIFASPFAALAQPVDGNPASGRQIATAQCSSCHRVLPILFTDRGVAADKDSPPSFQSIADLPSTTGISLNVFLHSNHKNMPNLILSKPDAIDVIAYVLSLKK